MKEISRSSSIAIVTLLFSGTAVAELSANIGLMSDYFYRGVIQNTTATTNGGLDYENKGFYLGTWAADVEDGLEVDIYGGYTFEFDQGFSLGLGFTGYYYTGDFDDTYEEINLSAAYGILSFEYSRGTYGNFSGPELDYDFTALTLEKNGFYAKVASFGDDFSGEYFELGYGTEIGGFDVGVSLLVNDEDLDLETGDGTESLIFSISKTFEL